MRSQNEWGMSIWKAFPLERNAWFTVWAQSPHVHIFNPMFQLVSLITTYAFVLLKMQPPESGTLGSAFEFKERGTNETMFRNITDI